MDRALLAVFLRARREALKPENVKLPPRLRRRASGLWREEAAVLAGRARTAAPVRVMIARAGRVDPALDCLGSARWLRCATGI